MPRFLWSIIFFYFISLITIMGAHDVLAKAKAGIGVRKIEPERALYPGENYLLPALSAVNTGSESAHFSVKTISHPKQQNLKVDPNWISFSPSVFWLKPSQAQKIRAELNLPVNATPGNYFGYILVSPEGSDSSNAAAARFYFTVNSTGFGTGYLNLISRYIGLTAIKTLLMLVFIACIYFCLVSAIVKKSAINGLKTAGVLVAGILYSYWLVKTIAPYSKTAGQSVAFNLVISLCGDNIISGSEDCEGEDLNGESCVSLGFGEGILSCDVSCSYDTSGCPPPPSPTPTFTPAPLATPTITITPTQSPTLVPSFSPSPTEAMPTVLMPTVTAVSSVVPILTPTLKPAVLLEEPKPAEPLTKPLLPFLELPIPHQLKDFDLDRDNHIDEDKKDKAMVDFQASFKENCACNFRLFLKNLFWPKVYPRFCDLNYDGLCSLKDKSILLYFIKND